MLRSRADQEIVNALSKMPTFSYAPTSRNTAGGVSVSIKDSKYDSGIMPVIFSGAVYHYKTTYAQGKNIEQTLPAEYK